MKVAIFQADAKPATLNQRLHSLDVALSESSGQKPELLLCPELFLSGYGDKDSIRQNSCSIEGESIEKFADIAARHGVAIASGYPEKKDDILYNSLLCLSSSGELLANHRKRIFPSDYEKSLFEPGKQITVFDFENGWRVALLICYEAEFPEAVRACALAGAQLVLVPTALGLEWSVVSRQLIPSRAFENGVYLAYANFAGADQTNQYIGDSVIVSPTGEDLARAGKNEEVICANIDQKSIIKARQRLPYLNDYQSIV